MIMRNRSKFGFRKSLWITFIFFAVIITFLAALVVYGVNQSKVESMLVQKNNILQKQLANNVDALFGEVDRIAIHYSLNGTVNRFLFQDIRTADDYMYTAGLLGEARNMRASNSLVSSMEFFYPYKKLILSGAYYTLDEMKALKEDGGSYYTGLLASREKFTVEERKIFDENRCAYKTVVSVSRNFIINSPGVHVIVNIDIDAFTGIINQISLLDNEMKYLVLNGDKAVISNMERPEDILDKISAHKKISEIQAEKINIDGVRYYISSSSLEYYNLRYMLMIPVNSITSQSNRINYEILKLFPFILAVCLLVIFFVVRKLYKPVGSLVQYIHSFYDDKKSYEKPTDDISFIRNQFARLMGEKEEAYGILQGSMPYILRSFLVRLVNGIIPRDEIEKRMRDYHITLNKKDFTVLLIEIATQNGSLNAEEYTNLVRINLEMLLKHAENDGYSFAVFDLDDGKLGIILNYDCDDENGNLSLFQLCKDLQEGIMEHPNITVTIAAGEKVQDLRCLKQSYTKARSVMEQRLFSGKGEVLLYDNMNINGIESLNYPVDNEKRILHAIGNCEKEEADAIMNEIFEDIRTKMGQKEIRFVLAQLAFSITHKMFETEQMDRKLAETIYPFIDFIQSGHDMDDYLPGIKKLCHAFIDYKQVKVKERNSELVEKVKAYIDAHCLNNITVEEIAEQMLTSSGRLVRIFRTETGKTVIDYIIEKKILYAMDLLIQTDIQIQEVSEKTGYSCSRSFIRAFKAFSGLTPGQFREKNKNPNVLYSS